MSRSSSLNPSAFEKEHYVRQILSKGLEKASCIALTTEETSTLNEMILKYPDTTIELLEPDIQSFAGTIEDNPVIFRDRILPLLLSSPLSEEYPPRPFSAILIVGFVKVDLQDLFDADVFTTYAAGARNPLAPHHCKTRNSPGPIFPEFPISP